MSSGKEMYLWWSGPAESMFVYYLTGTLIISFIAAITITRSLRRVESIVTELIHQDNTRDVLVPYLLKIVTSLNSGCGCPRSAKVSIQLTGEHKMSQYFQLRSKTGGKAMLDRGLTDIFLFKVPDTLGEIISVKILVSGLSGPLRWRLKEVQLYNPATGDIMDLPVTATLAEVLELDVPAPILTHNSLSGWLKRSLLLYHQWCAMYGNTIRLGAFTEIIHVLSVFTALLSLLLLTQIAYISLPRGEGLNTGPQLTTDDNEDDDSGPFNIQMSSFFLGTIPPAAGCSMLILGLEIVLRTVRSSQNDPGIAYYTLCDKNSTSGYTKERTAICNVEHIRSVISPSFYLHSCDIEETIVVKQGIEVTHQMPYYLEQLFSFLEIEHTRYIKKQEEMDLDTSKKAQIPVSDDTEKHEENDDQLLPEIVVPNFSDMCLDNLLVSDSSLKHSIDGTYLDILKNSKPSGRFSDVHRDESNVKQLSICNKSNLLGMLSEQPDISDSERIDGSDSLGNTAVSDLSMKSNRTAECFIDIDGMDCNVHHSEDVIGGNNCNLQQNISLQKLRKLMLKEFRLNEKTWCRQLFKEIRDVIKYVREGLLVDELDVPEVTLRLLNHSQTVHNRLMVACSIHCTEDQCTTLNSEEMVALMSHLSMEIMVNTVYQIVHTLHLQDNMVLSDIALQSHNIMLLVNHAITVVMYMIHYETDSIYLLRQISLVNDVHCTLAELLKGCFELVVEFNLVLWKTLKNLVNRDLKKRLEIDCYEHLLAYVDGNICEYSTEETVKRLCVYVEEIAKAEAWDDIHNKDKFYTNILVKGQLLKTLKNQVGQLTKKKYRFDKANDLLPKEPKSRLHLLAEKRRTQAMFTISDEKEQYRKQRSPNVCEDKKHVTWNKDIRQAEVVKVDKVELERYSAELGQYIQNLTDIYERMKKVTERQGFAQSLKGSVLLAQAALHPHVITKPGAELTNAMYKFENCLHLKHTEKLLARAYEERAIDQVEFLLKSIETEYNLKCDQQRTFDMIINDIIIKVDTVAEVLSQDVEKMMHRSVKLGSHIEGPENTQEVQDMTKSEVSDLETMDEEDLKEVLPDEMNSDLDENTINVRSVDDNLDENIINVRSVDDDLDENIINVRSVDNNLDENIINVRSVDDDLDENIINVRSVDDNLDENTINVRSVDNDLDENIINVRSVDNNLDENIINVRSVDDDLDENIINVRSVDDDLDENIINVRSVDNNLDENIINVRSVDNNLDENIINVRSVDNNLDENIINVRSVDDDLDENTINVRSVDDNLDENTINVRSVDNNLDENTINVRSVDDDLDENIINVRSVDDNLDENTINVRSVDDDLDENIINVRSVDNNHDENTINVRSVDDDLDENIINVRSVDNNLDENIINVRSVDDDLDENIINVRSVDNNLDENTINVRSVDADLDENIINVRSVDNNLDENIINVRSVDDDLDENIINVRSVDNNLDENIINVRSVDDNLDENNSNIISADMMDVDMKVETPTWNFKDIIDDMKPLRRYVQDLKDEETIRNMVTHRYIERAKQKRNYLHGIQVNTIIDNYFMLDDDDESHTLTQAGLYQLEYDCLGESCKCLPPWLKMLTVMLILLLQVLIIVYITVIGGQFTTTELQEWMCYFLMAVAMFGLLLEPLRACLIAVLMRNLQQKLWPK